MVRECITLASTRKGTKNNELEKIFTIIIVKMEKGRNFSAEYDQHAVFNNGIKVLS